MLCHRTFSIIYKTRTVISKRDASQISFIGLGQMGAKMARNLIKNENKLKVFDKVPAAASSIKGAEVCDNLEKAVEGSDLVVTMLPNGKIVKDIALGEQGILNFLPKGTIYVDCSTIEPQCAVDVYNEATKKEVKFLDAPVSGGVTGAEAGTLTFMVGGEEDNVKAIEPTLLQMGSKIYHCGKPGSGQVAKMCNNLILGVTMIGTCEAMNLAAKLGLSPRKLSEIVNTSTGKSWSSECYNPVPGILPNVPASNNYKGGFGVPLMAKDLGIAENAAQACGASVPLTAVAHQLYRIMMLNGYCAKDFSSVFEFLKGKH